MITIIAINVVVSIIVNIINTIIVIVIFVNSSNNNWANNNCSNLVIDYIDTKHTVVTVTHCPITYFISFSYTSP